jgi:hypothetical protein
MHVHMQEVHIMTELHFNTSMLLEKFEYNIHVAGDQTKVRVVPVQVRSWKPSFL